MHRQVGSLGDGQCHQINGVDARALINAAHNGLPKGYHLVITRGLQRVMIAQPFVELDRRGDIDLQGAKILSCDVNVGNQVR